ncbi:MAG TPA: sigma-54-dependent Fis family transcriptional regulator [Stenotrophomonas sp.]|nr:sigma-54-dependent Fis family transcriptional regulator [Stenotrophomonas sp.]
MEERLLRRAWEDFVTRGMTALPVAAAVVASWTRSRQQRVDVARHATERLGAGELHRLRNAQRRLLAAAREPMAQADEMLARTDSMLLLSDADGVILRAAGDPRSRERGGEIGLGEGGRWREADIGTNAIGTALALARPVCIRAYEHYCSRVQGWGCAAAPITDPASGRVMGTIDLSGPPGACHPHDLSHALTLSRLVETRLAQQLAEEAVQLTAALLGARGSSARGGTAIALGRGGVLLHADSEARRRLSPWLVRHGTRECLALLADDPPARWRQCLRELLPDAEVELVDRDDDIIGATVRLPPRSRPAHTAAPIVANVPALIGESAAMHAARRQCQRIAGAAGRTVLIEGETGVGKELFARLLHQLSRPAGPFVPVNCGGLPRELIGSEIFGYARGAFTGADPAGHPGKLEAAAGGTLCLDEIGELPLEQQAYLLRVLEDGVVYRIGSHVPVRSDARVIAMTHRDLAEDVRQGRFRHDLYYRIAVLRLPVPPLRAREGDIALLARHFLLRAAEDGARPPPPLSAAAVARLAQYQWPGNVRELRNVMERLLWEGNGEQIGADDVAACLGNGDASAHPAGTDLRSLQREAINAALRDCQGNLSRAARQLGIARSTLYERLRRHAADGVSAAG